MIIYCCIKRTNFTIKKSGSDKLNVTKLTVAEINTERFYHKI